MQVPPSSFQVSTVWPFFTYGVKPVSYTHLYAHAGCGLFFRAAEVIAEPLKGQTRALLHAHHVPGARYGAAERVHAALRIDGNVIRVRKHNAGGADGCNCLLYTSFGMRFQVGAQCFKHAAHSAASSL